MVTGGRNAAPLDGSAMSLPDFVERRIENVREQLAGKIPSAIPEDAPASRGPGGLPGDGRAPAPEASPQGTTPPALDAGEADPAESYHALGGALAVLAGAITLVARRRSKWTI
nr:hypothetical protein [Bacillota bacterium]